MEKTQDIVTPTVQAIESTTNTSSQQSNDKTLAILAYIIFFLPLLGSEKTAFGKFHANQGLILLLCGIAANTICFILSFFVIGACLWPFVLLGWIGLVIFGMVNASQGKMEKLPVIGEISLIS